jgi:hypothetical protein
MARRYEIPSAFKAAIKREANGRQTVSTQDFVTQLSLINWNWSLREVNEWIEWYVITFRDVSTQEGENRTFQLFNPNGGLSSWASRHLPVITLKQIFPSISS